MKLGTNVFHLIVGLVAACTGDDSGASDTSGGDRDATDVREGGGGWLVVTDDPDTPFVSVGETGTVMAFHADLASGRPSGLTIIHADGRTGELGLDAASGLPVYWVADGYVWTFANVRPEVGLVDVGLIAPDGSSDLVRDLEIPPVEPGTPPITFAIGADERAQVSQTLGALSVAVSLTVCVGSTILATGAAVGTITFPPGGVPLFETAAGATALACASAFASLMALRPENTTSVALSNANEHLTAPSTIAGLGEKFSECLAERKAWDCVTTAIDFVQFGTGQTMAKVFETYVRLVSPPAVAAPFHVFCCSGPSQVKVGSREEWRASVIEGVAQGSFTYMWSFGDDDSETWLRSDEYSLTMQHVYEQPGVFTLRVSVQDESGSIVHSNATAIGPRADFKVEAYEPLGLECCSGALRGDPGQTLLVGATIRGGRPPFEITLEAGDGKVPRAFSIGREVRFPYAWAEAGTFQVRISVTDADGKSLSSELRAVTIGSPQLEPTEEPPPTGQGLLLVGACGTIVDEHACQNFYAVSVAVEAVRESLKSPCEGNGATWYANGCPSEGSFGSCVLANAALEAVYYVDPGDTDPQATLASTRQDCLAFPAEAGGPGTWVAPYVGPVDLR